MRKLWFGMLTTLILLFAAVPSAFAIDMREGVRVTVEKGETVNDDLFLFGNTNIIDGTVNGDVFAFGQDVLVQGTINGNLVAGASRVEIAGNVTGSVLAGANTVIASGRVDNTFVAGGSRVETDAAASIGRSLVVGADHFKHDGTVGRGALIGANSATFNGRIGQELQAWVNNLTIKGTIEGPVTYTSGHEAVFDPAAKTGPVTYHYARTNWDRTHYPAFRWWSVVSLIGFVGFGLLILALFPVLRRTFPQTVVEKPWQVPLTGLITFVAFPFAFIILLLTVVGIPFSFMTMAALFVMVFIGQMLVAYTVGKLMGEYVPFMAGWNWPLLYVVGAVVVVGLKAIPGIGWFFGLTSLLYGLGGMLWLLGGKHKAA
ncbi:MAG TPA: hypothetical protein VD969_12305 [Symbiobacteriaceae bacterium]|nr:hypothetical protein [Symbiobacteriaceae bacterium]